MASRLTCEACARSILGPVWLNSSACATATCRGAPVRPQCRGWRRTGACSPASAAVTLCVIHSGTSREGSCLTNSACTCSVLEPGRTLTLAEKGGAGAEVVTAAPGFRLVATMNPGGDYGKKELSPALSNRFTQVPAVVCVSSVHKTAGRALELYATASLQCQPSSASSSACRGLLGG